MGHKSSGQRAAALLAKPSAPHEGAAEREVAVRAAKHRKVEQVRVRLQEAADTGKVPADGLRPKLGVGRMAATVKRRR